MIRSFLPSSRRCIFLSLVLAAGGPGILPAQNKVPDYELPPVNYSKSSANDAVTRLQRRMEAGELTFTGTGRELLLEVLRALNVPIESQTLVFSKTSLQKPLISPSTPRAIYFSDTVYVGWLPGGLIEVAAIDPQLGPTFYSLKANAADAPKVFVRDASCLLCHGYFFVRDTPSLVALTIFPAEDGEIIPRSDFDLVNDATRFEKRWGGWYVTGYNGKRNHRGNAFASGAGKEMVFVPSEKRPTDLTEFFDTSRYPAATSDMLALLILEHQMVMSNSMTRVGQNVRLSKFASEHDIVDHLLFRRSVAIPEGVTKNEAFLKAFMVDAKRSRAGDSLKDVVLEGRIFRNRCSYLIYSEAFAALPASLKSRVFDVLYQALRSDNPEGRYGHLEQDEKKRIYEILVETHPEARQHFEQLAASQG